MTTLRKTMRAALPAVIAAFASTSAIAGEYSSGKAPVDPKQPEIVEEKGFCDYWKLPPLYKNSGNPFLQELSIIGRYQGQYYLLDSDQGSDDDWENRRWRVGAKAKLFNFITAAGTINIDDEFDPFYKSLEEAYLTAEFDAFNLNVGKFKPRWSHEWSTSSKRILTFERSLIINQLLPDKSAGVSVDGEVDKWDYELGIWSGHGDDEFGDFNEGVFMVGHIGYDFSESTGLDKSAWRFDYLWNSTESNNNTAPYNHSFATAVELGQGQWGLVTEAVYAAGDNDAWGIKVMPTYDLTENLQLVGRYQYAHGDNDSLRAQSRYERRAPDITDGGRGEDYNAVYLGLNYYICDHKLKLMSGVEYANLDDDEGDGGDFEGWTWFNGIRLYF